MGRVKSFILAALTTLFLSLFTPAKACDVGLVLLMDRSGSMTDREFALQARGTADALRSEDVIRRIQSGNVGYIYVIAATFDETVVWHTPWTRIATAKDVNDYADTIQNLPRPSSVGTYIGWSVLEAIQAFNDIPDECTRNIIDVSTDGVPQDMPIVERARAEAAERNITINAIMVAMSAQAHANLGSQGWPQPTQLELIEWAETRLITGPNSFAYPATFQNYSNAMRVKLASELAGVLPRFRYSMIR